MKSRNRTHKDKTLSWKDKPLNRNINKNEAEVLLNQERERKGRADRTNTISIHINENIKDMRNWPDHFP